MGKAFLYGSGGGSAPSPALEFTYTGQFTQIDDSVTATTTVSLGTVSVAASTFKAQISAKGTYTFTHNGTNWTYGGNTVTLSDYGINLSEGTPASGNTITVVSGDAHTRVKFLTSGTLRFTKKPPLLDVFMVGGGGAVGTFTGGGGGGYTSTILQTQLLKDTDYTIVVGGSAGNTTCFGNTASKGNTSTGRNGADGGSGGGASSSNSGGGGANGGNGMDGSGRYGGYGQGYTTYEFGELGTTLYSGGGGGSDGDNLGGAGGGGNYRRNGVNGLGGGAGGTDGNPTTGGSGVVIIRDARGA